MFSEFQKIYDRLNIKLTEKGESFYQTRMETLVKDLEARGLLEEDEGRKILWGDRSNIPFTIIKSDGGKCLRRVKFIYHLPNLPNFKVFFQASPTTLLT